MTADFIKPICIKQINIVTLKQQVFKFVDFCVLAYDTVIWLESKTTAELAK